MLILIVKYTNNFSLKLLFCIEVQPINNVVIVSDEQQRDSVMHMHVSTLPQTPHPSSLPRSIEQSSLCYTVSSCWSSILNVAVRTYVSIPNSLTIPSPLSLPPATTSLFSKSVSLFLFHKLFVCINFLDSTHKPCHIMFVFLSGLLHSV